MLFVLDKHVLGAGRAKGSALMRRPCFKLHLDFG